MTYDVNPPSDSLLMSLRAQMTYDVGQYIANGGGKVASVRIEIEFGSGESIGVGRAVALGYTVNLSPKPWRSPTSSTSRGRRSNRTRRKCRL